MQVINHKDVIILKTLDSNLLNEIVQRLVNALHPEKIYLFGSHAYGQPNDDSDVDLLIVVNDSDLPPRTRTVEGYRALREILVPAEIVVVAKLITKVNGLTLLKELLQIREKYFMNPNLMN